MSDFRINHEWYYDRAWPFGYRLYRQKYDASGSPCGLSEYGVFLTKWLMVRFCLHWQHNERQGLISLYDN